MDEADLHKNGIEAHRDEGPEADCDLPRFSSGLRLFPAAWSEAANEGLISEEEYVDELIRHTRAENERTMPGVPWPEDRTNKQIGTR